MGRTHFWAHWKHWSNWPFFLSRSEHSRQERYARLRWQLTTRTEIIAEFEWLREFDWPSCYMNASTRSFALWRKNKDSCAPHFCSVRVSVALCYDKWFCYDCCIAIASELHIGRRPPLIVNERDLLIARSHPLGHHSRNGEICMQRVFRIRYIYVDCTRDTRHSMEVNCMYLRLSCKILIRLSAVTRLDPAVRTSFVDARRHSTVSFSETFFNVHGISASSPSLTTNLWSPVWVWFQRI